MTTMKKQQTGSFLLEAVIGILIFFIGVLAMIALQANSIAIQNDAQYRIEAANLADQMLGQINLNVTRDVNGNVNTADLAGFSHQATGGTTTCNLLATDAAANTDCCNFSGAASGSALVTDWVNDVTANPKRRLPGTTAAMQQIVVDTATVNRVAVTVCWQGPKDGRPRVHRIIGYIN
ncbi:MAG: type IV pilus modification protein PilV [Rugosibacter sp.]|nr:type IV pilus modification protein PilV [Rugosibacter sp.]